MSIATKILLGAMIISLCYLVRYLIIRSEERGIIEQRDVITKLEWGLK